jgi:lipoprotein-anchoring transpeptidase ErfK/SrfK
MSRALLIAPLFLAGLSSVAFAGPTGVPAIEPAPPVYSVPVQYREAEVYFDGNGNRVLVDPLTGEVVAVQPRRRNGVRERREALREQRRQLREQDRYYLDEPDDVTRLRRDQLRERRYELPDYGYGAPEERYPEEDYGSLERDYDYGSTEFPGVPSDPYVFREEEPRQPDIERAPLDGDFAAADPAPFDPGTTGTVGEDMQQPLATERAPSVDEPGIMDPATPPTIKGGARESVAALQVLLDRAGASPGVIDGQFGSNVDKALSAYRRLTGTNLKSTDTDLIRQRLAETGGDPLISYTITPEDAAGPFVASVPADYGEKARLEHMSFTSVTEKLAERFHMDEDYLKALNPQANFSRPGTIVMVANVGEPVTAKVARITADKKMKQVLAYDAYDRLVAAYPATIGSSDTPSPSGTHEVSRIAFDPNYTYNPKLNFKQGGNDKVLTIPPGPNGPVGSIWIALDKPTYGVHGTPEPSKIGKTESHGCVRLTNWDAHELAKMVSPGTVVEFLE